MKMGWKSLMVAGAVLVILSSLVMAQPIKGEPGTSVGPDKPEMKPESKGPGHPAGLIPVLAWWLDLTKEQVEQMHAIVKEARVDGDEAAEAVAAAQAALHEAVAGGASEEEIRTAATVLGMAIGDQAVLHAQTVASLKAVLTEEQLKEFDKIKTKLPQLAQLVHNAKFRKDSGVESSKSLPQDKTVKTPTVKTPTGKMPAGKGDTGGKLPADDGTISPEAIFKAADANKDGVLTLEELQAFLAVAKDGQQAPTK